MLTQRAVCANIAQIGEAIAEVAGERSLVVAPLFHAAMVPSTLAPLAQGGSIYVQPDFRPPEVVRVLDEEHIGFAVLVPAMLLGILSGVSDLSMRRFEALRLIYYGSSPIAEPTLRTAMDAFGCGFMQSYGMTEATQAVTFLTPADHLRALAGHSELLLSAGRTGSEPRIPKSRSWMRWTPASPSATRARSSYVDRSSCASTGSNRKPPRTHSAMAGSTAAMSVRSTPTAT